MLPITHIASEFAPIAKVGGMGDVTYGLSMEQSRQGEKVRIILPLYSSIDIPLSRFIQLNINQTSIDIYRAKWLQFELYFIDLPEYFHRDRIYGCLDDTKRFGSFALAAAHLVKHLKAPFVHLHDWQTAIAAPLLKKWNIPTLYTIHNLFHQGTAPATLLKELGIDINTPTKNSVNFMEIGIDHATLITTVSPTYAQEILTPPLSCGLEKSLNKRKDDLHGILNGIDIETWDSRNDHLLEATYTLDTVTQMKKKNRLALQSHFGMDAPRGPLLISISRFDPQKNPELICTAMEKWVELGGQAILIGVPSNHEMELLFDKYKKRCGKSRHIHLHRDFNEKLAHLAFGGSDFILVPSLYEPCGLTQIIGMRYGTIPIVRKTGGLADTVTHNINGISFEHSTILECNKAIEQAFHLTDSKRKELLKRGMDHNWGWEFPTKKYKNLYRILAK
ncbi:MAG: glycogen/starch synthase [Simkaniaceae bacterium]|nr:glycogen/starch synthase [Simkaniaceae bacterium]